MSVVQALRRHGAMEAKDLAWMLWMDIDDVYAELIHAESAGLAHIRVTYAGRQVLSREWVAA